MNTFNMHYSRALRIHLNPLLLMSHRRKLARVLVGGVARERAEGIRRTIKVVAREKGLMVIIIITPKISTNNLLRMAQVRCRHNLPLMGIPRSSYNGEELKSNRLDLAPLFISHWQPQHTWCTQPGVLGSGPRPHFSLVGSSSLRSVAPYSLL